MLNSCMGSGRRVIFSGSSYTCLSVKYVLCIENVYAAHCKKQ